MKDILISAKDLKKEFRTGEASQTIFEALSLDIYKGDFTVIMGASGAGKSTLMYSLSGMDRPTSGSIVFSDKEITKYNSETFVPTLYVYLNDAADTEKIIDEIEQSYGDKIVSTMNYQKMTETTQEMYSGITTVIVVVIFILMILIVLFVLYIVIKTLLVQRKQELGIYKAIGYSNKQLMVQMIGNFLPSSIVAVLLSSALGLVYVPQINQFIFQTIGALKNNMEENPRSTALKMALSARIYLLSAERISSAFRASARSLSSAVYHPLTTSIVVSRKNFNITKPLQLRLT